MKLQRAVLSVVLVTAGFLAGYLARGPAERAPRPVQLPGPSAPRPASSESPRAAPEWRTKGEEVPSLPPERHESSPPIAPGAPASPVARLEFPDGGPSAFTFEQRLRRALEDCRQGSANLSALDCTEFPCIGYLSLPEGASLRALADCPALASLGSIGVEGMGPIDDAGTTLAAIWVRPEGAISAEARLRIGERACGLGESYGATCDGCTRCLLGCLQ